MKLSIAVITKNEEKNIRRLLESVKSLKDNISYEIIIVDTGSSDNTIAIAEEYTDKIYEYTWNNDFSEARNVSISHCVGEWILVLDADEELADKEKIIDFLNDEDNKRYNSCEIICRSYGDIKLNTYADCGLYRLFRNNAGFHYEGKIHEQPMIIEPVVKTDIIINHYGYLNDDVNLVINKYERNIQLLLDDLDKNIKPEYTKYQMYKTYSFINKKREARKIIKEQYKNDNSYRSGVNYGKELYNEGEYKRAIEVLSLLEKDYETLDVFFYLGVSYYHNKQYREATVEFNKYIDEYNKIKNVEGYEEKYKSIVVYSINFIKAVEEYLIKSLYYSSDYKKVVELYEKNKSKDKSVRKKYIYSMIKLRRHRELFGLDNNISDEDIEYIDEAIERYNLVEDSNCFELIKDMIGNNDKLDYLLNKVYLHKDIQCVIDIEYGEFYNWKAKILGELVKDKYNNIFILEKYNQEIIGKYLNIMSTDCYIVRELYELSRENIFELDVNKLKVLVEVEKILLISEYKDFYDYRNLVVRSGINSINYTYKKYNKEIIEENLEDINRYDSLWIKLRKIIKNDDLTSFISELKAILNNNREYSNILEEIAEMRGKYIITDDMIEEKKLVVNEAEKLISKGSLKEALDILKELEKIFVFDEYILMDIGIIYYMLGQKEEALGYLLKSYYINEENSDICYNLACLLEDRGCDKSSEYLYNKSK